MIYYTNPTQLSALLDNATGNEIAFLLQYITNKLAGNDTGLVVNQIDTASPGTSLLADFQSGGVSKVNITNAGVVNGTNAIFNAVEVAHVFGAPVGIYRNGALGVWGQTTLALTGVASMDLTSPTITMSGGVSVNSTTKAFSPPRMTQVQRDAIASPTAGMVVYNTDTNVLNFYNGAAWGAV